MAGTPMVADTLLGEDAEESWIGSRTRKPSTVGTFLWTASLRSASFRGFVVPALQCKGLLRRRCCLATALDPDHFSRERSADGHDSSLELGPCKRRAHDGLRTTSKTSGTIARLPAAVRTFVPRRDGEIHQTNQGGQRQRHRQPSVGEQPLAHRGGNCSNATPRHDYRLVPSSLR